MLLTWWTGVSRAAPAERPAVVAQADEALGALAAISLGCESDHRSWLELRGGVAEMDRAAAANRDPATHLALLLRAAEGHGVKSHALSEACIPEGEGAEYYGDVVLAWADDELEARQLGLRAAAQVLPIGGTVGWLRADIAWLTSERAWYARESARGCWLDRDWAAGNAAVQEDYLAEAELERTRRSLVWPRVAAELSRLGDPPVGCLGEAARTELEFTTRGITEAVTFADWLTLPYPYRVEGLVAALDADPECPQELRAAWHQADDARPHRSQWVCGTASARGQCGVVEPWRVTRPHRNHAIHLAFPSPGGVGSLRLALDDWAAALTAGAPLRLRDLPDVAWDAQDAVGAVEADASADLVARAELRVSLAAALLKLDRAIPPSPRRSVSDLRRRLLHDAVDALDAAHLLLAPSFRPGSPPLADDDPLSQAMLATLERANLLAPW